MRATHVFWLSNFLLKGRHKTLKLDEAYVTGLVTQQWYHQGLDPHGRKYSKQIFNKFYVQEKNKRNKGHLTA